MKITNIIFDPSHVVEGSTNYAEVEIEMEEKTYILRFAVSPYNSTRHYYITNSTTTHPVPVHPTPYTMEDFMPSIKQHVSEMIVEKLFKAWDDMEKLKK